MRTEDKAVILAPEALDEVEELIATLSETRDTPDSNRAFALVTAAEICARRFVLASEGDSAGLGIMVALTTLAREAAPGTLSPWITELVDGMAADEEFAVFIDPYVWIHLAETQPPDDTAALILLRLASLATPPDDPDQDDIAAALSERLMRRHGRG
jgi:hypothetical protein